MDFGVNKTSVEVIKEGAFEPAQTLISGLVEWRCAVVITTTPRRLGRRLEDDKRQINRWKKNVNRFRGKLVKMIKDAGSKYDDYSISPKVRQILLHWGYELTEKDFFINLTN